MKTVVLEYEGDFDSNYRIDYRGIITRLIIGRGTRKKGLMAEATLDSGSSGDFGPVAVPLRTALEAVMVPAWARVRARQATRRATRCDRGLLIGIFSQAI
jgi:hypothetical protein